MTPADPRPDVPSLHVARVVHADPAAVYDYAADPDHLPRWAAGLASGPVSRDGDALVLDSPMGRVRVRFVARNDLGVLDHDVALPDGTVVTNPMRVLPHPDGAEVVLTVRGIGMTAERLAQDAALVAADLDALAAQVEGRA